MTPRALRRIAVVGLALVRLAAAVEALRRGDEAAARKYMEGMPSWPEGTPLECSRRDLVARLDGGGETRRLA